MVSRRDVLRYGIAAGGVGVAGGGLFAGRAGAASPADLTQFLCPPDDRARQLNDLAPSPTARPFVQPLFAPPTMQPVERLDPAPDPRAHQRYEEFRPQRFYEIRESEFQWAFHPDGPYTVERGGERRGSWVWGFRDRFGVPSSPGPTYRAKYGEPVLTRRFNELPTVGHSRVRYALPSTTSHLHNGHTASESDGQPQDWIDSGEFWDHHYANFPSGFDPREKLTTLWYHDHRLDFTAANVYAGLFGFYLLFDDEDTGDENTGWRLPSYPDYDVPLVLQDLRFRVDEDGVAQAIFENWNTDGMIGDQVTVNRRISPYLQVEPRKYRFRILNGGPSRFYQVMLLDPQRRRGTDNPPFVVITGDGNFQPEPLLADSIFLSVAQRVDVIVDFSGYRPGDHVYLANTLEQLNGATPSGRRLEFGEPTTQLLRFDVVAPRGPDNSRIPDFFRPLPRIDPSEAVMQRTWTFDYVGGLWTINGRVMDPNRIDAGIAQGTAEIWTFRNGGNAWSHPIHSHFTEFIILEVNGKPVRPTDVQTAQEQEVAIAEVFGREGGMQHVTRFMGGQRRDVATLLPGDEVKVIMRWKDFLGKYVMHCHNVVHEDHAMMIRWDIVEPGKGFVGPRTESEVYGVPFDPPFPDPRPPSPPHLQDQPSNPVQGEG
jgi:FtsP/CotA-like multicopper oxidase with cupredoxin domain